MDDPKVMCQLCFNGFYKEQLASAWRDPNYVYTDICPECQAREFLGWMKHWSV